MSSPCPFVLSDRHPHAIEMLKEIFNLSVRDYDVLTLCSEGPLSSWQCHSGRKESAKHLEDLGLLAWVFPHQRWEMTDTGRRVFNAITYYISEYAPPVKAKAPVVEFPSTFTKRNTYS